MRLRKNQEDSDITAAISAQKDAVRRLALLARSRVPAETRAAAGERIATSVCELPEIVDAGPVLAFASFGAEVPTDALLSRLLSGHQVLLPYVESEGVMRAAELGSLDDLEPGYRGIREPRSREAVEAIAAAIVPGVAFDERGGRLGHGGGFYDRFLADLPASVPLVGICFEAQVVDDVPREPHDRMVHVVVTEQRVIRCR